MPKVTIIDVAKLSNVSTATVSNYINGRFEKMSESTKLAIKKAIENTGYVPNAQAQAMVKKSSGIIAVLILDNTNAWAAQMTNGIEDAALEAGYQTIICNSRFDPTLEADWVEKMLSIGIDGLLIQPTNQFRAVDRRIAKVGKPVVYFDCDLLNFNTTWIKSNLYDGVYSAATHCIEAGYEQFLIIGGAPTIRTRIEREYGFTDALEASNKPYERLTIEQGSLSVSEISQWLNNHILLSKKNLIFVPNQWALKSVHSALYSYETAIPKQIGLLGFNNTDWTDLPAKSISTIVEPVYEEGYTACKMLLEKIKNPSLEPEHKLLTCKLNWLKSTI